MKKILLLFVFLSATIACAAQDTIPCRINTSLGSITIELYPQQAPLTVKNFLAYVDQHLYDSSSFFRACTPVNEADRTTKIEVIQGGNVPDPRQLAPIPLETTQQTNILHKNGTLSMARAAPDSATSEFFICINDQPELDYGGKRNPDGQGFAAFGRVTQGMDIVAAIQAQKERQQYLVNPVVIYAIRRK